MLSLFLRGTVTQLEPIAERMRRIRISGPDLRELEWVPGTHVRLRVGDPLRPRTWPAGVLRTYSIWDHSPDGHLDLCVLDHPSAGPGARWARRARIGDTAALMGPKGRLVLRENAPYHLFAGDETAAVAFGAMLRALPAPAAVHGVIVTDGPGDRLPLPRSDRLTWIHRPAELPDAVRSLDLPGVPGVAYLAGEARACQAVRRHLVDERGWSRRDIVVKPFWTPGRRGMD
ncbi:siderophore-interacting protein [Actinomadura algeriensis]|uniref:NADPH-dependent ferric siderophore reductase n=1 Tax=Actinomadura algeriensis TaxID=1679523 RepID=A0ABR9JPT6_9ACTN|nr:siderophore-interacting protein [Actinomadura algeriensis]MBE1532110.1 NADPH-dependent ferric siderophore reductase [Actinomadura algeriensis]